MNAVPDKCAGFMRYLKGRNIKPCLRIMFALHNFTSVVKDDLNRDELPWLDMQLLYNQRVTCTCTMCQLLEEPETWRHATMDTVSFSRIHGGMEVAANSNLSDEFSSEDDERDGDGNSELELDI